MAWLMSALGAAAAVLGRWADGERLDWWDVLATAWAAWFGGWFVGVQR